MSDEDKLKYLQSLASVRERSQQIFDKVKEGASQNWSLDLSKLPAVVDFIAELITRDYTDPKDIPPHTRWRHIDCGGVKRVVDLLDDFEQQHVPKDEQIRRIIDLFVVSVLLDAGAGSQWKYQDTNGLTYTRSEGLAIASFNMFTKGAFSSSAKTPCRVDARGLLGVTLEQLAEAFQHNPQTNKLEGLEGRWTLLNRLAFAMNAHPEYFKPVDGKEARPGYLYDYLFKHPDVKLDYQNRHVVHISLLWDIIVHGLGSVWPESRTKFNGISLGDVWPADLLKVEGQNEDESLVTFHKLSQWLTYSLLEPLESLGGLCFEGKSLMTGLPEYRNGGLFVDLGVLTLSDAAKERGFAYGANLKANDQDTPIFEVYDQVIVEWRAITVILLDIVAKEVPGKFNLTSIDMPLANVLEGGSWKAGREIAAKLRPKTRGPPVQISSDGTVF